MSEKDETQTETLETKDQPSPATEKTNDQSQEDKGKFNAMAAQLRKANKKVEEKENEIVDLRRQALIKDTLKSENLPEDFAEFVNAVDEEGIKAQVKKLGSKFDEVHIEPEKTEEPAKDKPKPKDPPKITGTEAQKTPDEILKSLTTGIKDRMT